MSAGDRRPIFRIARDLPGEEPLEGLLREYRSDPAPRAEDRQVRFNCSCVRKFLMAAAFAGAVIDSPASIRPRLIEEHLQRLAAGGARPGTVRNHKGAIGSFCTWLRRRGLLESNPARDVELPPLEDLPHTFLTDDQRRQALRIAAGAGILAEVILAAYGGLRMAELRRLRWRDVHLADKYLLVLGAKGRRRARKWRRVWLHPLCLRGLRAQRKRTGSFEWVFPGGRDTLSGRPGEGTWARNRPRGRDAWLALLRPLQVAMPVFQGLPAGYTGRGWHMLRHTMASLGLQHRVPLETISGLLGHSSLETTRRHYAWLAEAYNPDVELL